VTQLLFDQKTNYISF